MPRLASADWAAAVAEALNDDPHFGRVAAHTDAALLFEFGDDRCVFDVLEGSVRSVDDAPAFRSWDVAVRAPRDTWERFLSADPPPFYQDLRSVWMQHDLDVEGDLTTAIQHWRALGLMIDAFGEAAR